MSTFVPTSVHIMYRRHKEETRFNALNIKKGPPSEFSKKVTVFFNSLPCPKKSVYEGFKFIIYIVQIQGIPSKIP